MRSLLWLACGALVCAACGGRSGPPAADATKAPAAQGAETAAPAFLPDDAGGWTRDGQVRLYRPDNLWEYINGGAEQYLAYGFEEVTAAQYRNGAGATARVDVYRMTERTAAFGIYTEERSPKASAVAIGAEGQTGSDSLRFWAGQHYVKLLVTPAAGATPETLQTLARAVAGRLGEPGSVPPEVGYFPRDGLVAGSVKYIPADVLGQSFLAKAFQADYRDGDTTTTLILLPGTAASGDAGRLKQYGDFLRESGTSPEPVPNLVDEAWTARDRYYGLILAARSGAHVVVALGAPDLRRARTRVSALLANLPGATVNRDGIRDPGPGIRRFAPVP